MDRRAGAASLVHLRLVFEPPRARIILDRPDRRNAMSAAMWRRLGDVCEEIERRPDVAAVTVEGSGGHFCAGADIAEFDAIFAEIEGARGYLAEIERSLNALANLDRPSLAKLEGSVIGGGLAIALACDIRFAAANAHFAVPPAKLGLMYGPVETRLLIETVGPSVAKDLLFSARTVDADEALKVGLVNLTSPVTELEDLVAAQTEVWTRLSAVSIRGAKKAVRACLSGDVGKLRALVETAAMGDDFREGRAAFRTKRAPHFVRET